MPPKDVDARLARELEALLRESASAMTESILDRVRSACDEVADRCRSGASARGASRQAVVSSCSVLAKLASECTRELGGAEGPAVVRLACVRACIRALEASGLQDKAFATEKLRYNLVLKCVERSWVDHACTEAEALMLPHISRQDGTSRVSPAVELASLVAGAFYSAALCSVNNSSTLHILRLVAYVPSILPWLAHLRGSGSDSGVKTVMAVSKVLVKASEKLEGEIKSGRLKENPENVQVCINVRCWAMELWSGGSDSFEVLGLWCTGALQTLLTFIGSLGANFPDYTQLLHQISTVLIAVLRTDAKTDPCFSKLIVWLDQTCTACVKAGLPRPGIELLDHIVSCAEERGLKSVCPLQAMAACFQCRLQVAGECQSAHQQAVERLQHCVELLTVQFSKASEEEQDWPRILISSLYKLPKDIRDLGDYSLQVSLCNIFSKACEMLMTANIAVQKACEEFTGKRRLELLISLAAAGVTHMLTRGDAVQQSDVEALMHNLAVAEDLHKQWSRQDSILLRNIALTYYNIGATLFNRGAYEMATEPLRRSCGIFEMVSGLPNQPADQLPLCRRWMLLASCCAKAFRFSDALDALRCAAVAELSASSSVHLSEALLEQHMQYASHLKSPWSLTTAVARALRTASVQDFAKLFDQELRVGRKDSVGFLVLIDEAFQFFEQRDEAALQASMLLHKAQHLCSSCPGEAIACCKQVESMTPAKGKKGSTDWLDLVACSRILHALCLFDERTTAPSSNISAIELIEASVLVLKGMDLASIICPQRTAELLWTAYDCLRFYRYFESSLVAVQLLWSVVQNYPDVVIDRSVVRFEIVRVFLLLGELEQAEQAARIDVQPSGGDQLASTYSKLALCLILLAQGKASQCMSTIDADCDSRNTMDLSKQTRSRSIVHALTSYVLASAFRQQMKGESAFRHATLALHIRLRLANSSSQTASGLQPVSFSMERSRWFYLSELFDSLHFSSHIFALRGARHEAEYLLQYGHRLAESPPSLRNVDESFCFQAARAELFLQSDNASEGAGITVNLDVGQCRDWRSRTAVLATKGSIAKAFSKHTEAKELFLEALQSIGIGIGTQAPRSNMVSQKQSSRGRSKKTEIEEATCANSAIKRRNLEIESRSYDERTRIADILLRMGDADIDEQMTLVSRVVSGNCDPLFLATTHYYQALNILRSHAARDEVEERWSLVNIKCSAAPVSKSKGSKAATGSSSHHTHAPGSKPTTHESICQAEAHLHKALSIVAALGPSKLFTNICILLALVSGRQQPDKTVALIVLATNPELRHRANAATFARTRNTSLVKESDISRQLAYLRLGTSDHQEHPVVISSSFEEAAAALCSVEHAWEAIHAWLKSILPSTATICVMALSDHLETTGASLLLACVRPGQHPVVVRIKLEDQSRSPLPEICCLIAEANRTAAAGGPMETKADKLAWWKERDLLNDRLLKALYNLEHDVLGPWKCLLFGLPNRKEVSAEQLKAATEEAIALLNGGDENLMQCLLAGSDLLAEDDIARAVQNLSPNACKADLEKIKLFFQQLSATRVPKTAAACRGGRGTRSKKRVEESSKVEKVAASVKDDFVSRETVLLVLGTGLDYVPWESLPCLKNQHYLRLPSLHFLPQARQHANQAAIVSPAFFVVNPGGDLVETEACLHSVLARFTGWSGIAGRAPSAVELRDALSQHSTFLYCGHGSGDAYLKGEEIEQLQHCPLALLMGCSSAALDKKGSLEVASAPVSYLLGGSPGVVGVLWDVTDRDLDRFSEAFLTKWLDQPGQKSGGGLEAHIQASRHACKLEHLVGAAPVYFGFPSSWLCAPQA